MALRRKRIGTPSTRSETPAWACPTLECHTPRVGAPSQHRGSETYPETREGSPLVLRTENIKINFVDTTINGREEGFVRLPYVIVTALTVEETF